MRRLKLRCIGIQTSVQALYIRFQTIYRFAALSRLNDIAISLALRVMRERGITSLLIRFGGIKWSL
jgi:hypothetical protein